MRARYLLALSLCLNSASACPVHHAVVLADGTLEIEGKRYANSYELIDVAQRFKCGNKDAVFVLDLKQNSHVTYNAVAHALTMFQKSGIRVGFINTFQYK